MEYVGGGSLHGYLKSKQTRRLEEWDAKQEARGGEANEPKTVNQFVNQFQNIEDSSSVLRIEDIQPEFNKNLAPTQRIEDSTSKKQDAKKEQVKKDTKNACGSLCTIC